jgi:hypothetical protein
MRPRSYCVGVVVVSSESGTIGVVAVAGGIVVAGGTGVGVIAVVVVGELSLGLDGRTSTSHFDSSSITYRVPSAVLTSVIFPPSLSVDVARPLS